MRERASVADRCFLMLSSYQHATDHGGYQRRAALLCIMLALLALTGCGGSSIPVPFPAPVQSFAITFTTATSYDAALQTVTNLGLQPGFIYSAKGSAWQPMGQGTSFVVRHLLVTFRYNSPADWMTLLEASPGVVNVVNAYPAYPDQPTPPGPPTATATATLPYATATPEAYYYPCSLAEQASTPILLGSAQAGAYIRVVFASPIDAYGDALAAVINLGLRLADPCREQAAAHGTPPPWQPKGQANDFASTHALVVATVMLLTSPEWQHQLAQIPGVTDVQTPYAPACS